MGEVCEYWFPDLNWNYWPSRLALNYEGLLHWKVVGKRGHCNVLVDISSKWVNCSKSFWLFITLCWKDWCCELRNELHSKSTFEHNNKRSGRFFCFADVFFFFKFFFIIIIHNKILLLNEKKNHHLSVAYLFWSFYFFFLFHTHTLSLSLSPPLSFYTCSHLFSFLLFSLTFLFSPFLSSSFSFSSSFLLIITQLISLSLSYFLFLYFSFLLLFAFFSFSFILTLSLFSSLSLSLVSLLHSSCLSLSLSLSFFFFLSLPFSILSFFFFPLCLPFSLSIKKNWSELG